MHQSYSDLFGNHISNNPLCDLSDVVENPPTLQIQTRKYSVERQVSKDTVRVFQLLSINVILFGNANRS